MHTDNRGEIPKRGRQRSGAMHLGAEVWFRVRLAAAGNLRIVYFSSKCYMEESQV